MNDPRQRFVVKDGGFAVMILDTQDNLTVCYMQGLKRPTPATLAMARVMAEALNLEAVRRERAARPPARQGTLPDGEGGAA